MLDPSRIFSCLVLLALPDVPLRSARFALDDRWLFWARMRMYPDRLVLTGWSLTGRYRRHISLSEIETIDHTHRRLRLELQEGEPVSIRVDQAVHWARFLRAHRRASEDSP